MSEVSRETDNYTCNIRAQIELRRAGRRKLVRHGGALCSGCYSAAPIQGQRYCKGCHANYERMRRQRANAALKRLRSIEKELSKGKDNGQVEEESGAAET